MKMINSFKKIAFALVFCSFLVTPQSTVCLNIGNLSIGENAKPLLICAGVGTFISLLGYAVCKLGERPSSDNQEKNRERDGAFLSTIKNVGKLLGCAGGIALALFSGYVIYQMFGPLSDVQEIDKARGFICQSKQLKKGLLEQYQDYIGVSKPLCKLKQDTDSLYYFASNLSRNIRSTRSRIGGIMSKQDHLKHRKVQLAQKINRMGTCTDKESVYMKQYDSICDQLSKQKNELEPLLANLKGLKREVEKSPEYRGEAYTVLTNKVSGLKNRICHVESDLSRVQSKLSSMESKMSSMKS